MYNRRGGLIIFEWRYIDILTEIKCEMSEQIIVSNEPFSIPDNLTVASARGSWIVPSLLE